MAKGTRGLYTDHLSKDRKLAPLVKSIKLPALKKRNNICLQLCASIISQQLSTRVADVIHARFLELYDGEEPTPQQILNTASGKLHGVGLSNAKAAYVQNVARFMLEQNMDDKMLHRMSNEEVLNALTQIKGVGRWTVEMLLMFALGRDDVFAIDDLIIQKMMIKIYQLDTSDKKAFREKMIRISSKWAPYRTHACRYLWRHK